MKKKVFKIKAVKSWSWGPFWVGPILGNMRRYYGDTRALIIGGRLSLLLCFYRKFDGSGYDWGLQDCHGGFHLCLGPLEIRWWPTNIHKELDDFYSGRLFDKTVGKS